MLFLDVVLDVQMQSFIVVVLDVQMQRVAANPGLSDREHTFEALHFHPLLLMFLNVLINKNQ